MEIGGKGHYYYLHYISEEIKTQKRKRIVAKLPSKGRLAMGFKLSLGSGVAMHSQAIPGKF